MSESFGDTGDANVIDHQQFIDLVNTEFPGALARIDAIYGRGLLHVEMGLFLEATIAAMDAGEYWMAEKHFRFIERVRLDADSELANAIDVSYLEGLALGECTPARHRAVMERMPKELRQVLIDHHAQWR